MITRDYSKTAERSPIPRNSVPEATEPSNPTVTSDSLSDFSLVVSHRIGSLLSSIEGYTDLVLSSLENKEDRDNAFRILEGANRIGGILEDVKHYQESLTLRIEPVDVRVMVDKTLILLADSEVDRLSFECDIPTQVLAKIDQTRITQALLSVLRNAFEATATSKLPVSFSVQANQNNKTILFKILNPLPIAEKRIRTQLFNPFFTTKAANLGLGLTMARRIFRAHGGDIQLTSGELEAVTEFSCTLPL